ncbi:hypothetical protein NQ176_g10641 [Zarea fungicola]|uniref:Uncharacterized protein n=1 Tax=Zarea fungicola TaxID=93591 RepID=A0ACC1MEJ8_9HYPO|nr:hypothetical protein NQ176_g10641 [Lecanicillium fungicola]
MVATKATHVSGADPELAAIRSSDEVLELEEPTAPVMTTTTTTSTTVTTATETAITPTPVHQQASTRSFLANFGLAGYARRTLGICLLLCVVFLWTLSNFLASVRDAKPWQTFNIRPS